MASGSGVVGNHFLDSFLSSLDSVSGRAAFLRDSRMRGRKKTDDNHKCTEADQYSIAAIRRGLDQAKNGLGRPVDDLEREMRTDADLLL